MIQASPFYSEFMASITDKLQKRGYHLLISIVQCDDVMQTVRDVYSQKIISGGIFMGDVVPNKMLEWISQNRYYAMLVNQRETVRMKNVFILNTENYLGALSAVNVLVKYGHRRIAHIAGSKEKASVTARFAGYKESLLQNDIKFDESIVIYAEMHHEESGYEAAKKLMNNTRDNMPTAIFCTNDLMAFGAIRALAELGYQVPGDISIMGFDNVETSKYTTPALSTVEMRVETLTEIAAENLVCCIETGISELPTLKLSEYRIVMRDSVADIS